MWFLGLENSKVEKFGGWELFERLEFGKSFEKGVRKLFLKSKWRNLRGDTWPKRGHANRKSYKWAWDVSVGTGHEIANEVKATIATPTANSSIGSLSCKIKLLGTDSWTIITIRQHKETMREGWWLKDTTEKGRLWMSQIRKDGDSRCLNEHVRWLWMPKWMMVWNAEN